MLHQIDKNISLGELAFKLGVSRRTISNYHR
ncbi:MAG: HTH domain-containing protein [Methanocellales archaeon]|nr:HTH domain-containing protein [Methanocellales archaeon]